MVMSIVSFWNNLRFRGTKSFRTTSAHLSVAKKWTSLGVICMAGNSLHDCTAAVTAGSGSAGCPTG